MVSFKPATRHPQIQTRMRWSRNVLGHYKRLSLLFLGRRKAHSPQHGSLNSKRSCEGERPHAQLFDCDSSHKPSSRTDNCELWRNFDTISKAYYHGSRPLEWTGPPASAREVIAEIANMHQGRLFGTLTTAGVDYGGEDVLTGTRAGWLKAISLPARRGSEGTARRRNDGQTDKLQRQGTV